MSDSSIRLLVADIDGTLLDPQKELAEPVRQSVLRVKEAGVLFTLISARPPGGVRFLIDALQVTEPIACYNGALICTPQFQTLEEIRLHKEDANRVSGLILEHGLDLWMFRSAEWFVNRLNGPHQEGHMRYLGPPRDMGPDPNVCTTTDKLVGVSDDYDAVKRCEAAVRQACGTRISATRSADYYLDVTHRDANKGNAVQHLAALMQVPLENVATIGDMPTDMLMFAKSGLSIAMGNASDEVKAAAKFTTSSNAEDGFAKAMDEIIRPRVSQQAGAER